MQPDHHPHNRAIEFADEHGSEPEPVVSIAGASLPSAEHGVCDSHVACATDEQAKAVPVEAVDPELRYHAEFAQATGVLLAYHGLSVAQAQELLLGEAGHRGVDVLDLAHAVALDPMLARHVLLR